MFPIDRTPLSRYERVYSSVTSSSASPAVEKRGGAPPPASVEDSSPHRYDRGSWIASSASSPSGERRGFPSSLCPVPATPHTPVPADRNQPLRYERVYSSSASAAVRSATSPPAERRATAAPPAPAARTTGVTAQSPTDGSFPSRSLKDARSWIRDELARETGGNPMSTYNTNSSYSRTYEKKVVEETPRVRLSSPPTSVFTSGITDHIFPSSFGSRLTGGLGDVSGFGGTFHSIKTTDDSISVQMDVKDYKPEELKVSVIGQTIVIEAKHGEKKDEFGSIERHFIRRIPLPKGVAPEAVTSTLTTEGALSIVALPPKPKDPSPPRSIPIKVQVAAAGDKA
ncbi:hypothetical protein PRIPAC_77561 [Pristionchus pacificus]|uniref:SHSP domain-containing protein n=1 Tax=Pristionchus pacificus TaxID=54126 RepID=A0A8R1V3B6_PRIPA|nr:hypothetical protein PRIPAC_77561 [Pristionchus pacificus]